MTRKVCSLLGRHPFVEAHDEGGIFLSLPQKRIPSAERHLTEDNLYPLMFGISAGGRVVRKAVYAKTTRGISALSGGKPAEAPAGRRRCHGMGYAFCPALSDENVLSALREHLNQSLPVPSSADGGFQNRRLKSPKNTD